MRIRSASELWVSPLEANKKKGKPGEHSANGSQGICPLVDEMRPKCFCHELTSQSIALAVRYCLGDYGQCEHYRAYKKNKERPV